MKPFCYLFTTVWAVVFCCASAISQSTLWYVQDYKLKYLDGNQQVIATEFSEELGYNAVFVMQASNGDLYVCTDRGGNDDFGSILKINSNGIVKIRDLYYAESSDIYLTEGKDGFIYGVSLGAIHHSIFRFRPDNSGGTQFLSMHTVYGFDASELTTTSAGDIIGTTKFHLYRIKPDFSGVELLYEYAKPTGKNPVGKLVEGADGYLYGVTQTGGMLNYGAIYKVRPDGTDYLMLHAFNNDNGMFPDRGLALDNAGNLYGMTWKGGQWRSGALFTLKTDGTGFRVLHSFFPDAPTTAPGRTTTLQFDEDGKLWGTTPGWNNHKLFSYDPANGTLHIQNHLAQLDAVHIFRDVTPNVFIIKPSNKAIISVTSPQFKVSPVPGALTYTIQLSLSEDFSTIFAEFTNQEPTCAPFSFLPYSTTFYIRAKASLWPAYGPTSTFTTKPPETYAFITKPANGSTDNPAPVLKVTANEVYPARWYTIELSTTPDFSANVLTKNSQQELQRTLIFDNLEYGTTYYARMKTEICEYGPVRSFTTMAEPLTFAANSSDNVDVYPNPTADHFNITTGTTLPSRVTITTVYGKVVGTFEVNRNSPLQVGKDFKKGIYLLRIEDANGIAVRRIIKE